MSSGRVRVDVCQQFEAPEAFLPSIRVATSARVSSSGYELGLVVGVGGVRGVRVRA